MAKVHSLNGDPHAMTTGGPKAKNAEWDESTGVWEEPEWPDETEEYEALKGKKGKGKARRLKASLKGRLHRNRLLQGRHSLHRRRMSDPNPNPSQKHVPA